MDAIIPESVGIGWRQPHYAALLEQRPDLDFLEVHSENFFADGGAARAMLRAARDAYPISLHGVGLALGSVVEPPAAHLERLARLVADIDPVLVSEHLCWGRADGWHTGDLLPMPLDEAALALMCRRVDALQRRLRRVVLVENISAYLRPAGATMTEPAFLNRLAARTGCGILLDINNIHVNACNFGFDPLGYVDAIDAARVAQYHLAGHERIDRCVVDTHGAAIDAAVFALYRHACAVLGPRPTLVERDAAIPALGELVAEAHAARAIAIATATTDGRAAQRPQASLAAHG